MQMKVILDASILFFEAIVTNEGVQNILQDKNLKFDLILIEGCVRPALIFSHIYKVPVIQVSSFGAVFSNYATIGASLHPFLYSPITRQRLNNLTLWENLIELYNDYALEKMEEDMKISEDTMLKKYFGNNVPSINELSNNVHMLFLNVHPIFYGIRHVPPSVVFMGGLHQKPDKELPIDLKSYLDSSKNGVIYVSFGTNVDPCLLPSEKIHIVVQTFSNLTYDILWKWNADELPGRTDKIRISKWFPQSDLLKHPKIKLFITQGGLQSTDEAITAGVPLIGMPTLGDQWYNVEKYEYHKIGIRIDMESLTEEKLLQTINSVIEDDSYRRNIIKLRELIYDQPMQPLERAVWWIEYILRHGGAKHLGSPAANLSLTQYLELKLVFTVLGGLLLGATILIVVLCIVYNFVKRKYISDKIKQI